MQVLNLFFFITKHILYHDKSKAVMNYIFIKYKGLLAHIKKYNDIKIFSLIWAKHNVLYYIGRNTSSMWTDTVKTMQRFQTVTVRPIYPLNCVPINVTSEDSSIQRLCNTCDQKQICSETFRIALTDFISANCTLCLLDALQVSGSSLCCTFAWLE